MDRPCQWRVILLHRAVSLTFVLLSGFDPQTVGYVP